MELNADSILPAIISFISAIVVLTVTLIATSVQFSIKEKNETERLKLQLSNQQKHFLFQKQNDIFHELIGIINKCIKLATELHVEKFREIDIKTNPSIIDKFIFKQSELTEFYYANRLYFNKDQEPKINEFVNTWVELIKHIDNVKLNLEPLSISNYFKKLVNLEYDINNDLKEKLGV